LVELNIEIKNTYLEGVGGLHFARVPLPDSQSSQLIANEELTFGKAVTAQNKNEREILEYAVIVAVRILYSFN
jgi:hypothetical protein